MSGALAMKQIYDDLGIIKPMSWHHRQDDDNVAHNWNSGESMQTIWRKLLDGSGEWDTSITQALKNGTLSRETLGSARHHYNTFNVNDSSIPSAAAPIARDVEHNRDYATDYWTGQDTESRVTLPDGTVTTEGGGINVAGKGRDLSPHDNALRTWYMQERIDEGLSETEYGTHQLQAIFDNVESKFLDDVYDNEGNVNEGVEAHWGLDLRRVGLGHTTAGGVRAGFAAIFDIHRGQANAGKDLDVLSDSYYETLTRGEVNWAAYQTDKAYQAAFKEMQERAKNDDDPLTVAADWDIKTLGANAGRTSQYVSMIRQVNKETNVIQEIMDKDSDGWKHNWEGRYDPDKVVADGKDLYVDGVKQTTASELYGRDYNGINPETGDRWTPAERGRLLDPADYPMTLDEPIKTQQAQVVKPNIQINQVTVKHPKNIPPTWDVGKGKTSLKIEA